ncbi:hypothetical protein CER18_04930 [Bartonella tribocorum]|uniref:Uncharacterized protein n=1 Tax=Bartonella tribocorum TaxID=85701 RepID=A0A2M6US90_9HYPH|nr:hypothetical protein CER18_04930 [Bartonella tribocorum]
MAEGIALGCRMAFERFIHNVQGVKSLDKSSYQEFFSIMFFLLVYVDILFVYCLHQNVFLIYVVAFSSIRAISLSLVREKGVFSATSC